MTGTKKKLLFVLFVLVTMFATGLILKGFSQFGGWTSAVTLFGVSYMVLWDMVTA